MLVVSLDERTRDWWGLANEVLPKNENLEEGTMTADQLEGRAGEGGDGQATGDWTMAAD